MKKLITALFGTVLAVSTVAPAVAFWENTPLDTDTWSDFEEDVRDVPNWNGNSFTNVLDVYNNCYEDDYIDVDIEYYQDGNWRTESFRVYRGGVLEDLQYTGRYVYISGDGSDYYYWKESEIDFGSVKSSRWFEFTCE